MAAHSSCLGRSPRRGQRFPAALASGIVEPASMKLAQALSRASPDAPAAEELGRWLDAVETFVAKGAS
jgi:hypothetical protein